MGLLAQRKRAMHLGPYRLEKIRQVEETTTLIIEDEIKRVPRRADGFERARHGDFGEQQKKRREASGGARKPGQKSPLQGALGEIQQHFSQPGRQLPVLAPGEQCEQASDA